MSSPKAAVISKHGTICRILDNDQTLRLFSSDLLGKDIIDEGVHNSVLRDLGLKGANTLMTFVETMLEQEPTLFDALLEVMDKHRSLKKVAKDLRQETGRAIEKTDEAKDIVPTKIKSKPVDINEADSTIKTQGAIAQALRFLTASSAWKLERLRNQAGLDGSGTVIAILDTAVDAQCLGKEVQQVDNCLPSKPPNISFGHGTVCAAIADGVAPKAQLIVYQVSADGESFDKAAILQALDRILVKIMDNDFIDVVSMSFDFNEDDEGRLYRRIKALADQGVVLVAAAGNSGRYQSQAAIPARFKGVISVGALDENGDRSRFNGCGIIDVYAPGENILIKQISSTAFEGTSYATPAVAGLVALLKQLYVKQVPGPPTSQIRQWIHHVEILKRIFENDMMFRPDNGETDIFDPFRFFKERAHLLKDNVAKYAQELGLAC